MQRDDPCRLHQGPFIRINRFGHQGSWTLCLADFYMLLGLVPCSDGLNVCLIFFYILKGLVHSSDGLNAFGWFLNAERACSSFWWFERSTCVAGGTSLGGLRTPYQVFSRAAICVHGPRTNYYLPPPAMAELPHPTRQLWRRLPVTCREDAVRV